MSCGDTVAPSLGTAMLPAPRGPFGAQELGLGQREVERYQPPTL